MKRWNRLSSWERYKEIQAVLSRKNDILFLIKTKQFALSDDWEFWQIVSDDEDKVIDYIKSTYDEYEIVIQMSLNHNVYRI